MLPSSVVTAREWFAEISPPDDLAGAGQTTAIRSRRKGWAISLYSASDTRWCNGSTRDFGSLCLGSNPSRVASSACFLPIGRLLVWLRARCPHASPSRSGRHPCSSVGRRRLACWQIGTTAICRQWCSAAEAGQLIGLWRQSRTTRFACLPPIETARPGSIGNEEQHRPR